MSYKGPREKLLQQGAEQLSDAELIAIFLRTGCYNCPVESLAQQLLGKYKSLRTLLQASFNELKNTKGIGITKYTQLQAALELGKRYYSETVLAEGTLNNTQDTKSYLKLQLYGLEQEVFAAIYLTYQNQIIRFEKLFYGNLSATAIHTGVLVKRALHYNASKVILAHNHPSGLSEPSQQDIQTTQLIKAALNLVEIELLDHLVVGNEVISLAERGLL